MHQRQPFHRSALSVGFALALLTGLAFFLGPNLIAADPPNQPFDLIYEAKGVKYRGIQQGLGMLDQTEGTIFDVEVGGPVVKAYLIWAGLGRDDDGVAFQRGTEAPVPVAPEYVWNNDTYGGNTWNCCGNELSVYAADITNLDVVAAGVNSYTVSGMSIEHMRNDRLVEENWGYSLLVVFEDPSLPRPRDIFVKLGNDGLFFRWSGLLGPNSDVQCIAFDPAPVTRQATFNVVIGGVENEIRPNGLWGAAGNEPYVAAEQGGTWTQTRGIINLPEFGINGIGVGGEIDGPLDGDLTGNGIDWPFSDIKGNEWDEYPVFDVAIAPDQNWACVQIESADRGEALPVGPGNFNLPASIGFLGFIGIIESADQPAIDIEKATNGEDADQPTGPVLEIGQPVTWTYVVTNTGTVTLSDVTVSDDIIGPVSCPQDTLAPGASMTCVMTGTAAAGQYANLGDVIGTPPEGPPVTDRDPSHYLGVGPDIDIEKATNGEDADEPTGPVVEVGDTVTWTYVVTNTGTVTLSNVTVNDDVIGPVSCPQDTLAPGASMTCVMTGTATAGQYANLGDVVGTSPAGTQVTDEDPSHYFAAGPAIDIEKATNGEDADEPTGPYIAVGGAVTWLYVVTNTGNVPLTNVAVTDDQIGAITCPQDTLAVGESMSCTAEGVAVPGQYANLSAVTGVSPTGQEVTDQDPSHYFGSAPAIDIEKATNGEDADTAPGPQIAEGGAVEWTYVVTNIGNVPLTNVTVTDDVEGAIACPKETLAVGESMICTLMGTATTADYANNSTVVGISPTGQQVTDEDPSHYTLEPTSIDDPDAPERPDLDVFIYLPISVRQ